MAAPRTVSAPHRTAGEILADFAADMDGLAAAVPPGIAQSIRSTVQTLRTDLELAHVL